MLAHTGADHTWCCPGQRRLAQLLGCCDRTVRRAIGTLERAGAIVARAHRFKSSDSFWLHPSLVAAYWKRRVIAKPRAEVAPKPVVSEEPARPPSGAEPRTITHASAVSHIAPPREPLRGGASITKIDDEGSAVAEALTSAGVRPYIARRLVVQFGPDRCRRQLALMRWRSDVDDAGAYLHRAILEDYGEPRAMQQARRVADERAARADREHDAALELARRSAERERADRDRVDRAAWLERLPAGERAELEERAARQAESAPPAIRQIQAGIAFAAIVSAAFTRWKDS